MDIKRLTDFCKAAAPWKAMDVLDSLDIPQDFFKTNTDFLIRLIPDVSDKLNKPNPLIEHINLTGGDIANISAGCYVMIRAVMGDLATISPQNERILQNTQLSVERIAVHYANDLAAITEEKEGIGQKRRNLYEEFKRACHARDYAALAKMYPRHDNFLGVRRKPDTVSLERGIPSIPQKLYEREKAEAIRQRLKTVGPLNTEAVSYNMMGNPNAMEDFEFTLAHLNRSQARNSAIHESLRAFLPGFEKALSDAPVPTLIFSENRMPG